MNNIINAAVTGINKRNEEAVIAEATRLLTSISDKQAAIKDAGSRIAECQKALSELNQDQVTVEGVFGGTIPQTANSDTITKVIAEQNKNRQFPIEQKASRLSAAILEERNTIAALNKSIDELKGKLVALNAGTVTAEQILS